MTPTNLKKKAFPIAVLSLLAFSGVAGAIAAYPVPKRQGIPIKAR